MTAAKEQPAGAAVAYGPGSGMDDDIAGLTRGSRVWYRQDATTWLLAELREVTPPGTAAATKKGPALATASITLLSGPTTGKPVEGVPVTSLMPANPEMQATIPDLTQLSYLNEPSILGNLQLRYSKDAIYTCAGPVLIALNPCKELPLYTPEVQHDYKAVAHESLHQLSPHVYLVAGAAYRAMVREGASQSIVINGESGAGKTETTKRAMKFLASLAGGPGLVEERVLETNPVLEAFGNAKTLRNHNSSRFGKLVEIHFNQTHHICGAKIRTYLLEKSRVVHQLPGERSYHVFYQLVRGADKRLRAALKLPAKPQDFKYLAQSGCLDIQGVDDGKEFMSLCSALADVGISPEQQEALFALISGLLWLGNITVQAVTDDSSKIKADAALDAAASMLGVQKDALAHALTHKKIRTRDELIVKPLNQLEATDAVDALAKAVYAGVFRWVVTRINESLDTGRRGSGQFIAILDIYGFECFTTNSFEQLCINYANEALQQQFTRHLFTLEQEEYMAEGIDWTKVEWTDNGACLDAIDAMPPKGLGVLAVLDSQCKFPKATDDTFMTALRDALQNNSIFSTDPRRPDQFLLRHYAGPVAYSSANFLEKNKDTLSPDLVEALKGSSSWLLADIGTTLADEADKADARRSGGTVSSRFSSQLKELLAMLDATGLHFVRCIKPNAQLVPASFSSELVLGQLRCCGVLEVARVSRAGFPTRYPHAAFVERYKVMLPGDQQALGGKGGVKGAVEALLQAFGVKQGQYEIGHTKVFFRPGVLGYVEDRWARMQEATLKLQATWRMWKARSYFKSARAAALALQSDWRARSVRVDYNQRAKERRAAICIQRRWRGARARGEYRRTRAAAVSFQMAARRHAFNKRVGARVAERMEREAAEAAEAEEARRREEGFEVLKKQYNVTTLDDMKAALACYGALRDELGARDPDQVRAALKVYGALQRFEGGAGAGAVAGGDEAAQVEALKSGLALAAAARRFGAADAAGLAASLELAAAARGALGEAEATPSRVGVLLREHTAAAAVLGSQARVLSDPTALADAVAARGEMRAAGLSGAAALAAVAAVAKAAGGGTPEQVSAAMAVQRAAGGASAEQVAAALALQKAAVHAGLAETEDVVAAGALRKAAGSSTADQVVAALKLQQAAATAGLDSPQAVSEAAALSRAAGESTAEQVAGALALQEAAVMAGLGTTNQIAAAAAVHRAAGAGTPEQVAAAMELLHAAGDSSPQQVAAALLLQQAAQGAGLASPEQIAAAGELAAAAGGSGSDEIAHALQLRAVALGANVTTPEQLKASLAVSTSANGSTPDNVAAALQLHQAAQGVGLASPEQIAAAGELAAAAGDSGPDEIAHALQLRTVALEVDVTTPAQLKAALAVSTVASGSTPDDVAAALKLQQAAQGAGLASPEQIAAAGTLAAAVGNSASDEIVHALQLRTVALGANITTPDQLKAALAVSTVASGSTPDDVAAALQLQQAAQGAGLASPEQIAAAGVLAAAAGGSGADELAHALQLRTVALGTNVTTPEQLKAALAVSMVANGSTPDDVAAALKLLSELRAAGAPTDPKALKAALSAAASAPPPPPNGVDLEAASPLVRAAHAAGMSDPLDAAAALSSWATIQQLLSGSEAGGGVPKARSTAPDALRRVRRALGMYGIAMSHGCGEKKDFVGAITLYCLLRDEQLTDDIEVRAAVALYGAVREEGLAPDELQAAVATWAALRDEAGYIVAPEDAREALRGHLKQQRQGGGAHEAAAAAVAHAAGNGVGVVSDEAVMQLRQQLVMERAARQRYAAQLEQQAVDWMEQVRILKDQIDMLRTRLPLAGNTPPVGPSTPPGAGDSPAAGSPGGGVAMSSLAADLLGKVPLFEDDANFILEVARGAALAPGMDPQSELDLLRKKYENWHKGFKERLRQAQGEVRAAVAARHRADASGLAGQIDLSTMPDLASPGLLGEEGSARSGDSWDGAGAGAGAPVVPKKKKGLFGRG